jgi:hypothetical protein
MNVNSRLFQPDDFRRAKRLTAKRKHDCVNLETRVPSKKAASLNRVRFHIAMNHQDAFSLPLGVCQQVFQLPDLVAAIN